MTIDFNFALTMRLHEIFNSKKLTLATAESCTGGGLAQQITAIAGSSTLFDRGFIVYQDQAKIEQLAVTPRTIQEYGAVSKQCAQEMAQGALVHSNADIALSITGVAGPAGGSPHKPIGTVYLGCATAQGISTQHHLLKGGRKNVRIESICHALIFVINQATTL